MSNEEKIEQIIKALPEGLSTLTHDIELVNLVNAILTIIKGEKCK